jgi:hypothetical protein
MEMSCSNLVVVKNLFMLQQECHGPCFMKLLSYLHQANCAVTVHWVSSHRNTYKINGSHHHLSSTLKTWWQSPFSNS